MLAFITGSGFYNHPSLNPQQIETPFGSADLLLGNLNGRDILMLSRHGEGHQKLPHHINHRANLSALKAAGATAVISCSVCGILDPEWPLGVPMTASDIFYPDNRLGDGSICSVFQEPGEPGRGHLLAASLLNQALTRKVNEIAGSALKGIYGQVSGPRFNTPVEIRSLQQAGVQFISQTCGPEAVLANELELPYTLAAFGIDYANGVRNSPTPVEELQQNLEQSQQWFTKLVESLELPEEGFVFENFIYRFD